MRSVYGQRKRALTFCNSTFTTIGEKKFCILHLLEDVKVFLRPHSFTMRPLPHGRPCCAALLAFTWLCTVGGSQCRDGSAVHDGKTI